MPSLILLNKPYGMICQFSPSPPHATLRDAVSARGFYPAGRLDTDSEGLVLLTDDGTLQHQITDPRHHLPKRYWVQVEGAPSNTDLHPLRNGIRIRDYYTRPAEVRIADEPSWLWPRNPPIRSRAAIPTTWLELTLREGRNRQIRHMTAAIGFPTLRLIRYQIGTWSLGQLSPGQWHTIDLPGSNPQAAHAKSPGLPKSPKPPKSGKPAHSVNTIASPPKKLRKNHIEI